jgi:hypothetical protein
MPVLGVVKRILLNGNHMAIGFGIILMLNNGGTRMDTFMVIRQKRMKRMGNVELPQEAFLAALKVGDDAK